MAKTRTRTTEYIKAATPVTAAKKSRKAKRGPWRDLWALLFRNRVRLIPYGVALLVATAAHLLALAPAPIGPAVVLVASLVGAWVVLSTDRVIKTDYRWTRLYAATVVLTAGVWTAVAIWETIPSLWSLFLLLCITTVLALPWWWPRRIRDKGKIPVHLGELQGNARRTALRQARIIQQQWTQAMSHADATGTDLTEITFDAWSVALDVRTGPRTLLEDLRKKCGRLETALDARRGSARVEKGKLDKARSVRIRLMLKDPHAEPIKAQTPVGDSEWVRVGLFETGQQMLINLLQHLLIAGRSGAGKSTMLQIVMWILSRTQWIAIVGLDMKPGAPELGRWERSMFKLGKTPADAAMILTALKRGLTARGDIMAKHGWQSWQYSVTRPWIAFVVDEAQGVSNAGLSDELDEVAALLRAYGGTLILCTQYPVKDNLPTTTKEQIVQTIGLKTKTATADRVIFGEDAQKEGWICSKLPGDRKGSCYIESDIYTDPLMARGDYLDEKGLALAVRTAPDATPVDAQTWAPDQLALGDGQESLPAGEDSDIEDAVIVTERVPDEPLERVLWALGSGATHRGELETMTGYSQPTVDKHLKILIAQGKARKTGRAMYARTN